VPPPPEPPPVLLPPDELPEVEDMPALVADVEPPFAEPPEPEPEAELVPPLASGTVSESLAPEQAAVVTATSVAENQPKANRGFEMSIMMVPPKGRVAQVEAFSRTAAAPSPPAAQMPSSALRRFLDESSFAIVVTMRAPVAANG
jgi:hypothetical protein